MQRLIAAALGITWLVSASWAFADLEEQLIKLDREWGEATKPEQLKGLLTEDFVLVDDDGSHSRKDMMAQLEKDPPSGDAYVAGGYSVRKIDDKVAVMVHTATADGEQYTSMHVWRKHDGKWKVAASASVEND